MRSGRSSGTHPGRTSTHGEGHRQERYTQTDRVAPVAPTEQPAGTIGESRSSERLACFCKCQTYARNQDSRDNVTANCSSRCVPSGRAVGPRSLRIGQQVVVGTTTTSPKVSSTIHDAFHAERGSSVSPFSIGSSATSGDSRKRTGSERGTVSHGSTATTRRGRDVPIRAHHDAFTRTNGDSPTDSHTCDHEIASIDCCTPPPGSHCPGNRPCPGLRRLGDERA